MTMIQPNHMIIMRNYLLRLSNKKLNSYTKFDSAGILHLLVDDSNH